MEAPSIVPGRGVARVLLSLSGNPRPPSSGDGYLSFWNDMVVVQDPM
jgi:hypothetical protein